MTSRPTEEQAEKRPDAKGEVDSVEDDELERVSGGVRGSSPAATKVQKVKTGGDGGNYIRPGLAGLLDPSGGG